MAITVGCPWTKESVAVVTGANKGVGLAIVQQLAEHGLTVILTARDANRGQAALDGLKSKGIDYVFFHQLDIRSSESAKSLAQWVKEKFGGLDILVNNAAIFNMNYSYESAIDHIDTNYRGVRNVIEALLPMFHSSPSGARIVIVTSKAGLYERLTSESLKQKFRDEEHYSDEMLESLIGKYLEDMKHGRAVEEGWIGREPAKTTIYSESKMFLNVYSAMLAKSLSKSHSKKPVFSVSFCPGVTDTDLAVQAKESGWKPPEGVRVQTAREGGDTGVWLALLPIEEIAERHGKLFRTREEYAFGSGKSPVSA